MKRLIILILTVCSLYAGAQPVTTQAMGTPKTLVKSNGYLSADSGIVVKPVFADTASAKLGGIDLVAGVLIRVADQIWMRSADLSKWILVGSGVSGGGGGDGISQLGNSGNLWLTRVNDSTYAIDTVTVNTFYRNLFVQSGLTYTNPSWIGSLAWSKMTGTPTNLPGYGITDATGVSRFLDSLTAHTSRFNAVTAALATKFNLSDTSAAFTPYARIEASATGSIVKWNSDRALGSSSILYDNGTNAGATGTFLAPAMKSATSTHYYSFRVDGNLGMGEVFSDGSYIQRANFSGYHYIQSVNTPVNGLFIGTYPGQSYINMKIDGRITYDTLGASAQRHTFKGSGRFTDSLFVKTLENLDDSSDVAATTKWVKQQLYGTGSGSGSSDTAHVIIDTTLNALAKVISLDSLLFKSIAYQINGVTKTPVKTDSTLLWNFLIDSSDIANFSVKVRSLFSATGPIQYSNGKISLDTSAGKHRSEAYYDTKYQLLAGGSSVDSTTVPLITFTAGAGFASDTAMVTDSSLFGSFFTGQYEYTIKEVQAVIKGNSGDSIVLKIVYNDSFNVDGTKINGAGLSVSNRVFGNNFTVSTNRTIPANNWVWLKPEAIITGKKPKYISLTVLGYKTYVTP